MVILLYLHSFNLGGTQKVAYNIVKNSKFKFVVVSSEDGPMYDDFKRLGASVYLLDKKKLSFAQQLSRITNIIKDEKVSIFHAHTQKGYFYAFFQKILNPKLTLIFSRHNTAPTQTKFFYWISNLLISLSVSKYTAVSKAVLNHAAKKEFLPKSKFSLIYNYVKKPKGKSKNLRGELGFNSKDFIIGSIGTLSPQKGFDRLIKVFSKVVLKIPEAKLLIVGIGEEKNKLQNLCEKLNLTEKVFFLGERKDVWDVYRTFNVFALASRWEGFGLVVTEAMLSDIPVVVSNVDGLKEVVPIGCGIRAKSNDEMVDAIVKLQSKSISKKFIQKAREHVEKNYSLKKFKKGYDDLYGNVYYCKKN